MLDVLLEYIRQMTSTLLMFIVGMYTSRLAYLLVRKKPSTWSYRNKSRLPCRTVVILGSGGHTLEMTQLLKKFNPANYEPRFYIMATSDKTSEPKILDLEQIYRQNCTVSLSTASLKSSKKPNIVRIPRSREVGQSYFTSIFTTLYSFAISLYKLTVLSPDLILCNGPGTCVPLCAAAFLLKLLTFADITVIFVESFCRVKSLSLSAKILLPFVDYVLVHWPELAQKNPRCHYIGSLLI